MKIINCFSNKEEKIFENDVIKLLLSAMNINPNHYNKDKLRYGKIAICVDADSDGGHIALLIMTALAYLAPDFIKENRLCWLKTPLYIVSNGKSRKYFFDDNDFNEVRNTIKGDVKRCKGLGALGTENAKKSMFDEENQRMEVLKPNEETFQMLSDLMGEDVTPRKDFVFNKIDFSEIRE